MKSEQAKYINQNNVGYGLIAECVENSATYVADHRYSRTGGVFSNKYKMIDIIPPVVYFYKKSELNGFFAELKSKSDENLEFLGLMALKYTSLYINDSESDVTIFDRCGKKLTNLHITNEEEIKTESKRWIFKLGDKKIAVGCNDDTDYDLMASFEFEKEVFNYELQRFVAECRELLNPKPPISEEESIKNILKKMIGNS